ncbi:MAG: hypothetical protein K9G41_01385 [Flavobacteriales bacterium]|nr:hypothetical protein [Flavobacteriales bacterium]
MSKGDRLFELVQSLELNEKRYFKLQASLQKKDSNLARLFDYYSDSNGFDEEELRIRFEGEKFLEQLAVTQNHLYESILKAMRLYHLKRTIEFRLYGMVQDVQFLYEKGLVEQAHGLLKKVRKMAEKHDSFQVILLVLEWESRFLSEEFYIDKDESDIDNLSEEYYEILGSLQNEREYSDLQSKIFNNYYKIGIERRNDDYKTNDQIVNQFALKDPDRALTFRSKCCFLNIHAQYNKINGNWEEAYRYRVELLNLVEDKFGTAFSRSIVQSYFVALNNLIPICVKLHKWNEVEELILKLESIEERSLKSHFSDEIATRIFLQVSIAKLALYTRLGNREAGLELVGRIRELQQKIEGYHRKYVVLHLYFNVSYFLFSIGEYSRSLRWLNMILNDTAINSVEDLHASTRLMTMILQFELGRSELLEYLARSTYRYLNKLEGLYEFEEIMLSFMKKFSKNDLLRKDKDIFLKLKTDLIAVSYEPGERNALSTLDLISWVESKISEQPLHELLKAKNDAKD